MVNMIWLGTVVFQLQHFSCGLDISFRRLQVRIEGYRPFKLGNGFGEPSQARQRGAEVGMQIGSRCSRSIASR